ncbi:MAG TPA: tetratricopeptide repeat protein [Candidatus Acidoferrum sp.]|nr:tetratricopeptide repeat protein [Candidatus Acidoferrum sp.]
MSRLLCALVLIASLPAAATAADAGSIDANQSLFTVMAAINAVGYKADAASPNNHPLRDAIQKELAKRQIPSLPALKDFFDRHRKRTDSQELSQYVSFALSCAGPPGFNFTQRDVDIPPDVSGMRELSGLLAAFYKEANVAELWQRSQPAINQYIARYQEPVINSVLQVNLYLRQMTSGFKGRTFRIVVELQAAPNQIQTRSYSDDYVIVVSPSPEPRIFDIRHGYLHYLLDPLSTRNQEILTRKKSLVDHAMRAQALSDSYKDDYLLLVTESLIKAVESRLDHKPAVVQDALMEGYILAPYFAEALPVYEKQESSMMLYYKEMVQAIDVVKEDRRLANVEFAKVEKARPAVQVAPVPAPTPAGAAKTLQDAEAAYSARDLQKAKTLFLKILEQTDSKPLHASAYYGLGRAALLEKDLDAAERLFQKSLDSEPEPFDKAWDHVYLGRLSIAAGDKDAAEKHLKAALEVDGATEKARQEAQQLLQQINKQ